METKESREGSVVDGKSASHSVCDVFPYKRDSGNEARNNCSSSEAHLPSRKDIADECGRHHKQKDDDSAVSKCRTSSVGLVIHVTPNMRVNKDKNHRRTVRVEVAEEVPRRNVGHNMFNGSKSSLYVRGVVHSKKDSSNELKSEE